MKIKYLFIAVLFMVMTACKNERQEVSPVGDWRGVIEMQGTELPFNFTVSKNEDNEIMLTLLNGDEQILIDDIYFSNDSMIIPMHIFDTQIKAKVNGNTMYGTWEKNYARDYILGFHANKEEYFRFESDKEAEVDISGRYEVYFIEEEDSSAAIGIFKQELNTITGTFLTPTGDYRYLEGIMNGRTFSLSTFDGEHAYLFTGIVADNGNLNGQFRSGKTWNQKWTGYYNTEFELPDPDEMTWLREGFDHIEFSLPDMNGNLVSLSDDKYENKVVIIQIFGTWCPNCMDETKFLTEWYDKNNRRGVEIIALSFERKNDFEYAKSRIDRMKTKFHIDYDFLFAGLASKSEASKVLPMLNQVVSFPTTIFIDKRGKVRRIHTGFNGPGTGDAYESYIEEFNLFMDKLIEE